LFVPYEKERKYRHYDSKEPNHHLYSWNVQTLGNLVEEIGFKVMEGKIKWIPGHDGVFGNLILSDSHSKKAVDRMQKNLSEF